MKKILDYTGYKEVPYTRKSKETVPYCTRIPDSPITEFIFSDTRVAWVWLILRCYIGYQWLITGLEKFGNPAWLGAKSGAAIKGFVTGALQKTAGAHPDVQGWYADFLQNIVLPHTALFSHLVVYGEIVIGLALIFGAFVGAASFFGIFMNANFLLAGTVSMNPIFIFIQLLLVMAYRTAGWYGLDRYILKYLGIPWAPGSIFVKEKC